MATPLSADRLLRALREEGLRVVEYRSWRTHNRNHKGPFGPVHGVMVHHTVTKGTDHSVALCYDGYAALPGPLCHGVIAKDGTVYLVGHGRANHAGSGDDDVLRAVIAETALPPDNEANTDGNARFYGFEAINLGDGKDPWPAAQLDAIERASAALCRAHAWGAPSVIGHLEWQPGKIDPRGFTMASMRSRIAERLTHPAGWNRPGSTTPAPAPTPTPAPAPAPPPVEEDPMQLTDHVQLSDWLLEHFPHDAGIKDKAIRVETAIAGAYAYARVALKEAAAARSAAEEAAAALRELGPDRPAPDLTPEQLDHIADRVADRIGERTAAQVVDLIAARLAN
ncbi:peptidoglycan recognition protein family protein [Streptomyces sp. C10-9-1]|uniref:peptidoglycan recognition protein family protein n=1 Tax=Streptomyces sp. C10-9-1 TaxID=1859285 RepID=UPI003D73F816